MAEVVKVFAKVEQQIVFCGSCVLALYARTTAPSALRLTKDVDCICTVTPFARLSALLAQMCEAGVLAPDTRLMCRYSIRASGTVVDVIDPEGLTTGATDPWVERAAARAGRYAVADELEVSAVTPPYFLAMKLAALLDRGPDEMSADAEDIVTVALEVPGLERQIHEAGLAAEIQQQMERVLTRYAVASWAELVDYHIAPEELASAPRVSAVLTSLAGEAPEDPPAPR
jgi:hypothetical protein